ncbi:MAG TPA: NAD(P)/FAD-dependent oxidoreductase [Geminicoccus sp.]|uniref:NAD(P)/FAD-dependent oxidoreductase n=1 Tax=Geminicoccus sp. TaxID=2024832 RepID=UPI002C0F5F44|nr:NAD(P)/FAD-dependent oxidoreductase [Geminicoccus sp.]HWL70984.1 NAD(P)/FAD-dependent oxidoreductase [Geminicoccus sp.]
MSDLGYAGPRSLTELESRLWWDLERLEELPPAWVPPRTGEDGTPLLDVAIIGAGMAGLATGFALFRHGIGNIRLFDRAPEGREGPWVTYGRMETLRSPKHLAGPALGLASLTFRAWFEAQFGAAAWVALDKIPRPQWMEYLVWLRRVTRLPVENQAELVDLDGDRDGITATLATPQGERRIRARRLVLANGRDGLGGPFVAEPFASLASPLVVHSSAPIDFAALAGKTVVVIGAGASAVDNAAEALEAGAKRVVLLVRRPDIPRVNKSLAGNHAGFARGFRALAPEARLQINGYMRSVNAPPPRGSMLRCSRYPGFAVRTGSPVLAARDEGETILLTTPKGSIRADFVIVATGFGVDWRKRPELARLADRVLRWRDVLPELDAPGPVLDHPFLGEGMEFRDRSGDAHSWLGRVYCMNQGAVMSHGRIAGDVPGISVGAQRVADHLVESLFVEDWEDHFAAMRAFDRPELQGDEWTVEDAPLDDPGVSEAMQPALSQG